MKKTKFQNLDSIELKASFGDFLRWRRERSIKQKDVSFVVPQAPAKETAFLTLNRTKSTITWIGHATFLIQMSGLNILTDPVWSTNMGFEKRMAPPGISLADMPEIDFVLISHNHYDHLDFGSLRKLKGNPVYLIPKGLKSLFLRRGFSKIKEFNWWDQEISNQVLITFTPAQHWSKRTLWDTNCSCWGGWVIEKVEDNQNSIYFVGDSGYFGGFREVGTRFKIDYILAPIGAYEPEWFMKMQHVTPEQAVQAYLDTGAGYFLPMHYEAFRLGDDTPAEALDRLKNEWKKLNLDPQKLKILLLGETIRTHSYNRDRATGRPGV